MPGQPRPGRLSDQLRDMLKAATDADAKRLRALDQDLKQIQKDLDRKRLKQQVLHWQDLFNQDAARGQFEPTTLTAILTQEADFSTFAHETAHYMLTVLENIVSTDSAPQELVADFNTLLKFWGVKDLETWKGFSIDQKREYHEAFAYNFERYLFEGKAPSKDKGMLKLFKEFKRFIKAVYQDVSTRLNELYKKETGKDLPILTNEVRSVMDRMLATDEQIVQANQIYDMKALFQTQEQSGMNDEQWAKYIAVSYTHLTLPTILLV